MTNYIKAELFRIRNKKNTLKYFIILFIMYLLTVIIRSSSLNVLSEGSMIFGMFTVFIGGTIFATVYNDDLSNKTISQAIGFGNERRNIIFSKIIVLTITTIIIYILGFIVFNIIFFAIGKNSYDEVIKLLNPFFNSLIVTIGFSLLSGIVAFATQKPTYSMVSYILLSVGVVKQIVFLISGGSFIKDLFGDINRFTLSRATGNVLSDNITVFNIVIILLYIVVPLVLSTITFNKKELEF